MEYNVLLILTPHPLIHPEGVPLEGVLENSPSGMVEVAGVDEVDVI